MKGLSILGSTGSIGTQTLDVVRLHPGLFSVKALACFSKTDLIEKQTREFRPGIVAVYDREAASELKGRLSDLDVKVVSGMEGLIEAACADGADTVLTALVGMIGIRPTVAAIKAGRDIALANKETCVTAGHIIMPMASEKGIDILPVDSEHSAIFQALQGRGGSKISRLLVTASGGPFRKYTKEQLESVTVRDALAHPTWKMGPKITVDSATMVNKGLEVIEARWLFDVPSERIEVVIQPQSIIHSMVEFEDGSVLAQMGPSDMRIPIQYALTWPDHIPSPAEHLDFKSLTGLTFGVPDDELLPGLALARRALDMGGGATVAFNAANEWANAAFRRGEISFPMIFEVLGDILSSMDLSCVPDLEGIFAIEEETLALCGERFGR